MPSVGFWSADTIETVHDFVLVRQDDYECFWELTKAGDLPFPQKVFVVAPNGNGLEDLLCLYVLGEHVDWDIAAIQGSMPDFQARYGAWRNLVHSLLVLDASRASLCISEFARLASPGQSRISRLVAVLNSYVGHCMQPLADLGVFRAFHPDRQVPWWQEPNLYGASLATFRKELAPGLVDMPALEFLGNAVDQAAKQWNSMAGRSTADKFFDLSAFCFGLAERYVATQHYQWGFLLAYRSVDLYFQYLGLRENVLIEKADEIGYAGNTEKIHVVDVEYALFQAQVLASNEVRRRFLVHINGMRNQLLMTHGAHHVTQAEASAVLIDSVDLVHRIESNSRWQQRSAAFFPPIQKGLKVLFESVPDIHTFVEERTVLAQPV